MPYIGVVEKTGGLVLSPKVDMVDLLSYEVKWKREVDGKLEHACTVGDCDVKASQAVKDRLQKKLDNYVGRYASYAERTGMRFEVKEREKRERKKRIRQAPFKAAEAIRVEALKRFREGERSDDLLLGMTLAQLETTATNLLIEVARRAEASARRT